MKFLILLEILRADTCTSMSSKTVLFSAFNLGTKAQQSEITTGSGLFSGVCVSRK